MVRKHPAADYVTGHAGGFVPDEAVDFAISGRLCNYFERKLEAADYVTDCATAFATKSRGRPRGRVCNVKVEKAGIVIFSMSFFV